MRLSHWIVLSFTSVLLCKLFLLFSFISQCLKNVVCYNTDLSTVSESVKSLIEIQKVAGLNLEMGLMD